MTPYGVTRPQLINQFYLCIRTLVFIHLSMFPSVEVSKMRIIAIYRPLGKQHGFVFRNNCVEAVPSYAIVFWNRTRGRFADEGKHQSSAWLAFVRGIHPWPVFPAQIASNAENVSIWWRHRGSCNWTITVSKKDDLCWFKLITLSNLTVRFFPGSSPW